MEAIYTTTGMTIRPFKRSKLERFYRSRCVFIKPLHRFEGVTAHIVNDGTGGKVLCTYPCDPDWLKREVPDMVITKMKPNHIENIEQNFELNEGIIPTDLQESVVRDVINYDVRQAFFNIPTGAGKTLLSTYLISLLKKKTWIICFRQEVLNQWKRTMEEMTTFNIERIRLVNSSKDLLKMADGSWDASKYDIYLSTPIILATFAQRHGISLLNDAFDTCGIGIKIFDEAHYNVGNLVKINALTNVERTYYLSADFGQSDSQKSKLYAQMFSRIPVVRPNESLALTMRYTVGVVIHYNTKPSLASIDACFGTYGFSHYKFMEYEIEKPQFMDAIGLVLAQIRRADPDFKYKVLILWNLIDHVDFFYDILKEKIDSIYGEKAPNVVRYHSKLAKEERRDALDNGEIIISTYQSMSVGVDLKRIRYVISLAPVSHIEDNQAAGRARALPNGEDCYYFIFQDDGFPYLQKRLPYRLQYLEQQKIKKIYSIKYS